MKKPKQREDKGEKRKKGRPASSKKTSSGKSSKERLRKKESKTPSKGASKKTVSAAKVSRKDKSKAVPAKKKKAPGKPLSKAGAEKRKTRGVTAASGKTLRKKPKARAVKKTRPILYSGEDNELIVMAVDPKVVFVDWEIKKGEVREKDEGLTLRVRDITGRGPDAVPAGRYFDIRIGKSEGNAFFDINMPGREIVMEIGYSDNGDFQSIIRSGEVSIPRLIVYDEFGVAWKLFESGIPVGY